MKNFLYSSSTVLGVAALTTLPAAAQTTFDTVEIFADTTTPGVVAPGGTAAEALSGPGNIELGETDGGLDGDQGGLTLGLGGGTLTLSSIVQDDWDNGLADAWFADAFAVYGALLPIPVPEPLLKSAFFDTLDGDARLSDPNIESVTELASGDVEVSLAGFLDLKPLVVNLASSVPAPGVTPDLLAGLPSIFASEVVAYDYQGASGFLYSIGEAPVASGVTAGDPTGSFSGNYTVIVPGTTPPEPSPTSVPEPSTIIGLALAGSAVAFSRRKRQSAA